MGTELISQILEILSQSEDPVLSVDVLPSIPSATIESALRRLESRGMVTFENRPHNEAMLTKEGELVVAEGSHEAKVYEEVRKAVEGLTIKELPTKFPDYPGIPLSGMEIAENGKRKAITYGWVIMDKGKGTLKAGKEPTADTTREQLLDIQKHPNVPDLKAEAKKPLKDRDPRGTIIQDLKKRKLVDIQKVMAYQLGKGPRYGREFVKEETDLTADMLASGAWKSVQLKPYNFKSKGAPTESGALHPLNKVRHEFRQIFFEMGFEEMPTNCYVETGFWNFDALFVPQQHPARDMQDTFFISDPPKADKPRPLRPQQQHLPNRGQSPKSDGHSKAQDHEEYWNDVKETHEGGKYGSIGYRYPWKEDEALRLVLRTHTTATSTFMLRQLAANPRPVRYFSIDRVFRNESVDATHLAEFHQVEGVIADWNLSLGGLIGFMEVFFAKMGIHQLRFKPAYNPYTEPSLEIFSYHAGLHKWVEIGNSGMFRPEMLEPMGLPNDMRVYGWGLSLERPTMIKYGVTNIRELLGHKVDLDFVASNPAVRLEKD